MIRTALDKCTDSKLYVAMNLSFACSLRMGEILGLTWDNVHISDEDIAADNAYVYVDKELTRASKRAIETLGEKDIYYIFTPLMPNTSTRIILKKPKTESSIRKVWLPKTLAYILREWKKSQDELRSFLGDEYQDFNLVVALPNGRPCEDRIILKEFSKLREEAGLPRVVFHSLRQSSTTYKLKLNHGDLKATQGDTGHAETVRVVYDADALPLEKLLRLFLRIIDPTSFEQQGEDIGNQYRTGISWTDAADEAVVRAELDKLQPRYAAPIVVEACPLDCFYPAEEYHQKYLDKTPGGYCHVPWDAIDWVKTVNLDEI